MDKIIEYLESALKNIRGNKMRTGLTMLGIVIGIASVIAVITIGNGMSTYVSDEINSIGKNIADVYVDTSVSDRGFTQDDIDAIKEEFPELLGASFYAANMGMAKGPKETVDAAIYGTGADYQYDTGTKMKYGTYFTEDQVNQGARVCVLLETDAEHLFGTSDVLGKTIELSLSGKSVEVEIIGIRENWSDMIMEVMELEGFTAMIQMPLSTYGNAFGADISEFSDMDIYWPQNQSDEIVKSVVRFLENRMGLRGQEAINQYSMSDVSDEVDSIMGSITSFVALVAAISLLVGGIGVMNIMLVSVTERTSEIGLKKALGAKRRTIMAQFLTESVVLTSVGGIIGVILGILLALFITSVAHLQFAISVPWILISVLFSMGVGIIFGATPASKAAKLSPIEALRRE